VADRLGDDTPRREGRVTLNPVVHIDPLGTILIPLLGALGFFGRLSMIGWAKPVYTNPANFKRGYFDQALVTLAGPGVNFLLALSATVAAALTARVAPFLGELCGVVLQVNVGLMVFNLLPIPPLDGSKFLIYWFGMKEETYVRLTWIGGIALIVLINFEPFNANMGAFIMKVLRCFHILYQILR